MQILLVFVQILCLYTLALVQSLKTCEYKVSYARLTNDLVQPSYDISGVGRCFESHIIVQRAWFWTTYPSKINVSHIDVVPSGYIAKNAIVWNSTSLLYGFVIKNIKDDGQKILMSNMTNTNGEILDTLPIQGECHFTLDDCGGGPDGDCKSSHAPGAA